MAVEDAKGGLTWRSMASGKGVIPVKFVDEMFAGRYFHAFFPGPQPHLLNANGYGDPTGGDTDENLARFHGPQPMDCRYICIGAATKLGPLMDFTNGYLAAELDLAAEGVEYVPGGALTAYNPMAQTIGTDPATFIKLKCKIADVSDVVECAVGFRKAEAFQAAIDDYDEMAAFNVQAGDVEVHTILNNGATVEHDTGYNWADGAEHTMEVRCQGRYVSMIYDGAEVWKKQHFDNAEEVIPFIHYLQQNDGGVFGWTELEVGRLWLKQEDPARR